MPFLLAYMGLGNGKMAHFERWGRAPVWTQTTFGGEPPPPITEEIAPKKDGFRRVDF